MTISATSLFPIPNSSRPSEQRPADKPVFDMREIRAELKRQYDAWKELPEDQKQRHLKLEEHGLSEQDLKNLPADERAELEQKIAEITNRPDFAVDDLALEDSKTLFRPILSLASVLAISGVDTEPSDSLPEGGHMANGKATSPSSNETIDDNLQLVGLNQTQNPA